MSCAAPATLTEKQVKKMNYDDPGMEYGNGSV